jgi:hypothetical protein
MDSCLSVAARPPTALLKEIEDAGGVIGWAEGQQGAERGVAERARTRGLRPDLGVRPLMMRVCDRHTVIHSGNGDRHVEVLRP